MKNLTQELKDSSVKKWENIVEKIEAEDEEYDFWSNWHPCGFCEANNQTTAVNRAAICEGCSLNIKDGDRLICHNEIDSHAASVLFTAAELEFDIALPSAKIVLQAIKDTPIDHETDSDDLQITATTLDGITT